MHSSLIVQENPKRGFEQVIVLCLRAEHFSSILISYQVLAPAYLSNTSGLQAQVTNCWLSQKCFRPSTVFYRLLQQLQKACQLLPNVKSVCNPDRVTLFQLSVYLKRWNIQELGEHISRISKEGIALNKQITNENQ